MKNNCLKTLEKFGASDQIIQFYSDALKCENEISQTIYKFQTKIKNDLDENNSLPPNLIFGLIQTMTKNFNLWRKNIEKLSIDGLDLPKININKKNFNNINYITAGCSIDTKEFRMKEGDQLQITNSTDPDYLNVKSIEGEGVLPMISCLIPTPDNNSITTVERLQVLLLTSWSEVIRQTQPILISSSSSSAQFIVTLWSTIFRHNYWNNKMKKRDKLTLRFSKVLGVAKCQSNLDINKLHLFLSKLENELLNLESDFDLSPILTSIESLDRAILCYQSFFNQWRDFRQSLNDSSRPIRIVEHWEELRRSAQFKQFKYYELKMILVEEESVDEIIFINKKTGEAYTSEAKRKRQKVTTEEMKTTKEEEYKKFIIKSVIDPQNGGHIGFKEAVERGVVNCKKGLYGNPEEGKFIPIEKAMAEKKVIIDYCTTLKGVPMTTITPLVTVKSRKDFKYKKIGAIDPNNAEKIRIEEAERRGVVDGEGRFWRDGVAMEEREAVENGWILADFDDSDPKFEIFCYKIISVFDFKLNCFLNFNQAKEKNIINNEYFINNKTGEFIYIPDALKMNLIKIMKDDK